MEISESILINAAPERVWDIFTDLTCWEKWSTVFSNVSCEAGRLIEGKCFSFCIRPFSFPMNIEPVVEEMVPGRRIVWSGAKHGITARHEFFFTAEDGKTQVTSREIFKVTGIRRLFFHLPKRRLHRLSVMMLNDLRNAAEKGQ
ncbi:MAG: SRPBCC domain-containing protein [Nitrospirota bacterium]|nr:SRPBCC domain-containing protein [Nitrospirota bacterium]